MPKNALYLLALLTLFMGSCVPIKRLTYLQENEAQKSEEALMATQFATTIADLLQGHYDLGFITDLARSKAALHDWSKVRLLWDALLR